MLRHFDAQCEGLFAMIFERMPEVIQTLRLETLSQALRIHRNLPGDWAKSRFCQGVASPFYISLQGGGSFSLDIYVCDC